MKSWGQDYYRVLNRAKDVAEWIEERDGYTVSRKVDDDEKIMARLLTTSQNREMTFLTEQALYDATND